MPPHASRPRPDPRTGLDGRLALGARGPRPTGTERWWVGAVGYQVYLRSFQDSDGDGIGDLAGLRRRLGHIADLGVDYLWITPFYPSPQADHGYDVSDYTAVDPVFGTLATFDAVVEDAHRLGLRVVIDVVPNHTSDQHPWFQAACRHRGDDLRDWYVWRDPSPSGGPPNNWVSKFGGPAWTWHEPTGQYYMHTFLAEQPDLNWANPAVHRAFERILTFWLDRGVDGFRIDTAHLLTEDPGYRDNPLLHPLEDGADPETTYHAFDHRYDLDQPDVLDIYRRWKRLVAPRGAMLLGEVGLFEPEPVGRYVADDGLDLAFYFPTLKTGWDADEIRTTLEQGLAASRGRFAWPLSSHDDPRAVQRFGGGELGTNRAIAYLALLSGLPGSTFLLQGDELGIDGSQLTNDHSRDPIAARHPGATSRNASRTPVPWSDAASYGFTTDRPWLPFPENTDVTTTVAWQDDTDGTPLGRTRAWLSLRRDLPDLVGDAPLRWLEHQGPIVAYQRGTTIVAMNTAGSPRTLPCDDTLCVLHATGTVAPTPTTGGLAIPADTTVVARVG